MNVIKGVNLGGWLLIERWMTPSLFTGLSATDEFGFCQELGQSKYETLKSHRDRFITQTDFAWLAEHGINAVRLPVGYWVLEDDEPFVSAKPWLQKAFAWASEYNLKIILDLHGAPGSQNGNDHSGHSGPTGWTKERNITKTINILVKIAKEFDEQEQLYGIELLNEPSWDIPLELLKDFYTRAYQALRQLIRENVAIIISDAFRPGLWNGFMVLPEYKNVVLDMHLYQCFSREDKKMSIDGHLHKAKHEWARLISSTDKPVIIGEWSLGLDPKTFNNMNTEERMVAKKNYAASQLDALNQSLGWFFWNYKTEDMDDWNFKKCVEQGFIKL